MKNTERLEQLFNSLDTYLSYQIEHDPDNPELADDPAWQMRHNLWFLLIDARK